jgi:hypothetical protein
MRTFVLSNNYWTSGCGTGRLTPSPKLGHLFVRGSLIAQRSKPSGSRSTPGHDEGRVQVVMRPFEAGRSYDEVERLKV